MFFRLPQWHDNSTAVPIDVGVNSTVTDGFGLPSACLLEHLCLQNRLYAASSFRSRAKEVTITPSGPGWM